MYKMKEKSEGVMGMRGIEGNGSKEYVFDSFLTNKHKYLYGKWRITLRIPQEGVARDDQRVKYNEYFLTLGKD